jgi:hypothetical protein
MADLGTKLSATHRCVVVARMAVRGGRGRALAEDMGTELFACTVEEVTATLP